MGNCAAIVKGMCGQELRNGRVVMGYLLGMAIMGYWMSNFLRYALDMGSRLTYWKLSAW